MAEKSMSHVDTVGERANVVRGNLLKITQLSRLRLYREKLRIWSHRRPRPVVPMPYYRPSSDTFIWALPLQSGELQFMSHRVPYWPNECYLVMVDADRFHMAWIDATLRGTATSPARSRATMHLDRKFQFAEDGFQGGEANPVPLAEVSADLCGRYPRFGFINGITRTMWLIANGCPVFPVVTYGQDSAHAIYRLAGIGAGPIAATELADIATMPADNSRYSKSRPNEKGGA